MNKQVKLKDGADSVLIWLYIILICIGLFAIFNVQYRDGENVMNIMLKGSKEYGKQLRWIVICGGIATFILLTDSKFFTATANLQYAIGFALILITFAFHSDVKGSRSFLGYGKLKLFQPAEFTKLFALLALSKFLSQNTTDFKNVKHQLTAAAIVLLPAICTVLQNETGVALVYFALFIPMYREGLPGIYLIYVAAIGILTVAAFLINPYILLIAIGVISIVIIISVRNNRRRSKAVTPKTITLAIICAAYTFFALPIIYNNVLPGHQKQRMIDLFGIEQPAFNNEKIADASDKKKGASGSEYNVTQSKIAIGSGGFIGKGPLNNTQTRYEFVPERHTDFIFCSIGESFGFIGSFAILLIYFYLLWRIIKVAERQRSAFSRVYAYGVASIFFVHIFINMAMTVGLAPVIGIPLPFLSYGGTSMITFTAMLFILIKLDADRQMALR